MTRCTRLKGIRLIAVSVLLSTSLLSGCVSQQNSKIMPKTDNADATAAYTRLGVAYLERNNLRRATASLNRALEISPQDAEALQALALVYTRQDETRLADRTFRQALAADPEMTRARNNYAAFLYEEGQVAEACAQLERASHDTSYTKRSQLLSNLGQCQRRLGNTEAARLNFSRAQNIDPRQADSYLLLARLEHGQGNAAEAERQLESYIRLVGNNEAAQRLAQEISQADGSTP